VESFKLWHRVSNFISAFLMLKTDIDNSAEEAIVASGILELPDVPAGSTCKIEIPGLQHVIHDDTEWWIELSFRNKSFDAWANAGHEIAWCQFSINSTASYQVIQSPRILNYPEIRNFPSKLRLLNSNFTFEFDKSLAHITTWSIRGNDFFDGGIGPYLTFWRAPTDNDTPQDAGVWSLFGLDCMQQQVRSVSSGLEHDGTYKLVVQSWISPPVLAWGFDTTTTYTIHGDGEVRIHIIAAPRGPAPTTLPRFGIEMEMNKNTESVKWLGRGPGESYCDKKQAARIGVWESNIDKMASNYEFPQENGNRTDTRWVHLTNRKGLGIRAILSSGKPEGERGFDFGVQRFSAHELQKAKHPHELGDSDSVLFRIDGGHHGLGTASCGPGALPQHQLLCQPLEFTVDLTPIS
jgi:hypothetical protein